jgi:predicted phosphoribosyltransferase
VIGFEIAKLLSIPLEILLIRKIGVPGEPELALGAVASGGFIFLNEDLIKHQGIDAESVNRLKLNALRELTRRESRYESLIRTESLRDKDLLIVDDGIATGASIEVAIRALKPIGPKSIAIAVPVASLQAVERLHRVVDRIYALQTPQHLGAIGEFYEEFEEVTDEDVLTMMQIIQGESRLVKD